MTLTEFLTARFAEDEATARAVIPGGGDEDDDYPWAMVDYWGMNNQRHGFRWAPARVLAECEAKRRIIALHPPRYAVVYRESEQLLAEAFDQQELRTEAHSGPVYDPELRFLALPYADHPDYQPEWKP